MNNLKSKRSMGNDIVKPLTSIINESLLSGKFPKKLLKLFPSTKNMIIIISTTTDKYLFCRAYLVFEKLVYTQLFHYLTLNKLLHPNQYGFRAEYCTELAISELVDRIYLNLDKKGLPLAIFLDLSKAFDTIDHTILFKKNPTGQNTTM